MGMGMTQAIASLAWGMGMGMGMAQAIASLAWGNSVCAEYSL